ncbi:hypothetical protein ACOSQ4_018054 [Xanthoceras sorbifolium]
MDLWVVAAATGAGYIAKYWKNLLSKEGQTSSQSFSFYSIHRQSESSNLLEQIWHQSTPLQRLALKQLNRHGFFMDEKEFAGSTCDYDSHENYNLLPLTSFPPGLYENESSRTIGNEREGKSKYFSDISRHLRSRYYGNFIEPLESLESRLEAQLCREYVTMEEYVYSSLPSPAVRPLLLTDGNQIISRAGLDFKGEIQLESRECRLQSRVGFEKNEKQSSTRKMRNSIRKGSMTRDSGFSNGKVPFVIGISTGVMLTILANRREVQNLKKLLNETESLVQDLHEELESWGRIELPLLRGTPNALNHEQDLGKSTKFGDEELDHHKAEIEAELEAELERLELNMRTCSLQRISLSVELDPDFVPDVVHGDLKLDKAAGEPCGFSDSDRDVSGTSTNPRNDAGNYAASPRELSLRLHEVIESRLEARIMELETALENSQNKLETLEMESTIPWRDLYSEAESSSVESSTVIDDGHDDQDCWL